MILNLMFLESETNRRWINGNPSDHIGEAGKSQGGVIISENYRLQFIESSAFDVLKRPVKSKADFDEFLIL
ncbi:hypothetical protein D3C80_2166050 [compost metagenome]